MTTLTLSAAAAAISLVFCAGYVVGRLMERRESEDAIRGLGIALKGAELRADALSDRLFNPHPKGHKVERWVSIDALLSVTLGAGGSHSEET